MEEFQLVVIEKYAYLSRHSTKIHEQMIKLAENSSIFKFLSLKNSAKFCTL